MSFELVDVEKCKGAFSHSCIFSASGDHARVLAWQSTMQRPGMSGLSYRELTIISANRWPRLDEREYMASFPDQSWLQCDASCQFLLSTAVNCKNRRRKSSPVFLQVTQATSFHALFIAPQY